MKPPLKNLYEYELSIGGTMSGIEIDKQIDQLLGKTADTNSPEELTEECMPPVPKYPFVERSRIADAFFGPDAESTDGEKSLARRIQTVSDMAALCKLREASRRGKPFKWNKAEGTADDTIPHRDIEETKTTEPLPSSLLSPSSLAAPNPRLVLFRPAQKSLKTAQRYDYNLTYRDVETYINGKFRHDANMLLIVGDEPEIAEELVREVLDMASGVFLWVKHPQDDAEEERRARDAEAVRELSEGAREIDGEEGMWQLQRFFEDSETLSTLPPSQD